MELGRIAGLGIPIGLALVLLFASILAILGQRSRGSYLMVIASSLVTLSLIAALSCFLYLDNSSYSQPLFSQVSSAIQILIICAGFFIFLGSIGFVAVARSFIRVHNRCAALEKEAQELATQRDSLNS